MTSPYFANKSLAVRLKGHLVWNEHPASDAGTIWTPYPTLLIGVVQLVGEMGDFVRVYGEGGAILLFPSTTFSTSSIQVGGYGLFGFEFFFDKHLNYLIEAGGAGTGARADLVAGAPIYSNGFVINVGVRFQF
ncbi:MAG: hypothetical protein IPJ85_10975 [Flavobacteriales bacterium]|nr:hypothetical protein [Flavobacteriales bacterium]